MQIRLLFLENGLPRFKQFSEPDNVPQYVILSHRWGPSEQELSFEDVIAGDGSKKDGFGKILYCWEQAQVDGVDFIWVDTCCIDKMNSTELNKAINSMFRWYQQAMKCYVYLSDVCINSTYTKFSERPWEADFVKSQWFGRGWTLQELLTPANVEFFSKEGDYLGNKAELLQQIHEISRIPIEALSGRKPLASYSLRAKQSWMNGRETTEEEDMIYALFGICGISPGVNYGEGAKYARDRFRMAYSLRGRPGRARRAARRKSACSPRRNNKWEPGETERLYELHAQQKWTYEELRPKFKNRSAEALAQRVCEYNVGLQASLQPPDKQPPKGPGKARPR